MAETERNKGLLSTYFAQIRGIPLLTFEEELALSRRILAGDKAARRRLIEANLRLVVKVARPFAKGGLPLIDLIQEGNLGLIRAAEKYDYRKQVRFSTYACFWIRQTVARYAAGGGRAIKLPERKEKEVSIVQGAWHILSQRLGREPRDEEIAEETGLPISEVEFIMGAARGILPLEADGEMEDALGVAEKHEDYTYNPERAFLKKSSRRETLRALGHLKERERRVLVYRFQLAGGERQTLTRIGARMGVSPETVRQIEMKALVKMRPYAEEIRSGLYAM